MRVLPGTPILPAVAALSCIALHAARLGLGRWQSDEFTLFANQRAWGWEALMPRLLYSPRPFSEGLLFLYGEAVLGLGQALTAPFLAVLWAGVLASMALAARSVLPPSRLRWPAALGLAGSLFAFVLSTNDVTEMFYWPVAAAAYLPTAGAASVLLFLLSHPLGRRRRLGCGAALLIAAASSEIGAVMAIAFAGAALVEAVSRPGAPSGPGPRIGAALRDGAWWIVPGLSGLVVMAVLLLHRTGIVELGADTQPYTGQAMASVGVALRQLLPDLAAGYGDATLAGGLGALATKLLFALGFVAVWRQADRAGATPCRWHAVLAASLGMASLFSIAAAYYHYGSLCCERQATTRLWLHELLAILAMAWVLAQWRPARGGLGWLPPVLLTLALSPILLRLDGIRTDYANTHFATEGRARTWRSGQRADTDRMEFYLPPDAPGMLIRGTAQPIGTFDVGPAAPVMVMELGRFFGKAVVTTCDPWQSEKSWVINGQFIPACPPNDSPPQVVGPVQPLR